MDDPTLGPSWAPLRWLTNTGAGNFVLSISVLLLVSLSPAVFLLRDGLTPYMFVPGAIVIASACMALFMRFGSPLNWWYPYFGTRMKANAKKIAEWVKTCSKSRWYKENPYTYVFLRKGDAMMFKLAWG